MPTSQLVIALFSVMVQELKQNGKLTEWIHAASQEEFSYEDFPYPLPAEGTDDSLEPEPAGILAGEWALTLVAKWSLTECLQGSSVDKEASESIVEKKMNELVSQIQTLTQDENDATSVLHLLYVRGVVWSKKQQCFQCMSKRCPLAFFADYIRDCNISKEDAQKAVSCVMHSLLAKEQNGETETIDAKAVVEPISSDKQRSSNDSSLDKHVMNLSYVARGPSMDAENLAVGVRKGILKIFDAFMANAGMLDYASIRESQKFEEFKALTAKLQLLNLRSLDKNSLIAFFINIYNALVIHGFIQYGIPTTTLQRVSFFENVTYKIGPYLLSLGDIEHGVMRANRTAPYSFFSKKRFNSDDSRMELVNRLRLDPRVHFALVCGAKSCPPLKVFSGENLNSELDEVGKAFLNESDNIRYDDKEQKVFLSKIFSWYYYDFGNSDGELLNFLLPYISESEEKKKLENALCDNKQIKIKYNEYDWGVNGSS